MPLLETALPAPALRDRAGSAFRSAFGSQPRWAAAAPGRVNLIGDHTDYSEGFVLPIAIDRLCVCVGAPAADPRVSRFLAVDLNSVVHIDLRGVVDPESPVNDESGRPAPWARYLIGVHQELHTALAVAGPPPPGAERANIDVAVTSSVPLGGGLSSSAALEVSLAFLLETMLGARVSPLECARLCRRAEHRYAKVPCGIMDQYVAVHAERDRALLIDCQDDTHESLPMPPADANGAVVLIVNSNVRHELAAGEYAKRHAACRDAARIMGYRALREVSPYRQPAALMLLPESLQEFVRHVVEENVRVNLVGSVLREAAAGQAAWKRALPTIGEQLVLSHESLRDLYKVSCPELDALVEIACDTQGVYGARMTGGGFGGCIVALVRPHLVETIAARLKTEYARRCGKECTVYQTTPAPGAATLPLS